MRFCRHLLLLVHFGLSGAAHPHQGQLLRSQSLAVSSSAALVAERGNADVKSDVSNDIKSNASKDVKSTVSKDAKSNGSTDVNLNHSATANQSKPESKTESKPFSSNKINAEASVVDSVPDPDHMEEVPEGSYALEAGGLEQQHEEHVETPLSKDDPIALADGVAKQHPHDEPAKHQEDSSLDFSVNETWDAEMTKAMESEEDPPVEAKSALIAQESGDGTEDEDMMADDMKDLEDVPQDGPNDLSEIMPPEEAALQEDEHDDPIKLAEEVAKQYPNDQLPPDAELEDLEVH